MERTARKRERAASAPGPVGPERPRGSDSLLVPLGALLSVFLPYVVFSLQSDEAFRDAKLAGQAAGGILVLAGLFRESRRPLVQGTGPAGPGAAAVAWWSGAGLLGLVLLSALASAGRVDPYFAVALIAPWPLLLVGAGAGRDPSDHGPLAARLLDVLALAGAVTGALAFAQRYLGVLRLPLQSHEPRYLASALVGNPGDVGAALVLPGIVLWARLADDRRTARDRLVAASGLAGVLLGLGATEAVTPLAAFAAGVTLHSLLDLRRRGTALAVLVTAGILAVAVTGLGGRLVGIAGKVGEGRFASAATQRDIGILAALEAVRQRPLAGSGPGAYSNVFVPARLAAEERVGRPLVHRSSEAHFENAHDDYLTLAAECGLPALVAALALGGALAAGLVRRRGDGVPGGEGSDAGLLLSLLAAAAVLMLGSFPLRLAVASGPIALALGLAYRRVLGRTKVKPGTPAAGAASLLLAVLLATATSSRFAVAWAQGEAEALVRGARQAPGPQRAAALAEAGRLLEYCTGLRPRGATALLDAGSVRSLEGDVKGAWDLTARSMRLEERAETGFNLGQLALAAGDEPRAIAFFVRSVWILPRLLGAVPPEGDPRAVARELDAARERLSRGGRTPPLPGLELPRPGSTGVSETGPGRP